MRMQPPVRKHNHLSGPVLVFGLGRYFYHFAGLWLPLDHQKRPRGQSSLPEMGHATGLETRTEASCRTAPRAAAVRGDCSSTGEWLRGWRTIEGSCKECSLRDSCHGIGNGASLYRGLLKTVARVWNPTDIRELSQQRRVLPTYGSRTPRHSKNRSGARELNELVANEIFSSLEPGFLQRHKRPRHHASLDSGARKGGRNYPLASPLQTRVCTEADNSSPETPLHSEK